MDIYYIVVIFDMILAGIYALRKDTNGVILSLGCAILVVLLLISELLQI